MNVKFPKGEDGFPKVLAQAIVCALAAIGVGLFLGNALGAFFGTDESVLVTSTYTDRMSAIRSVFTDGDQLESFTETALTLKDQNGRKLYTSRDRDQVLVLDGDTRQKAQDVYSDSVVRSFLELMNNEDALYGLETTGGAPITDVWLRNIAVRDGVVYYYLYYDEAGFAGVAYDSTHETLDGTDNAIPLTKTSENGVYEWFIIYAMED